MGAAVSYLARRGGKARVSTTARNGFRVFNVEESVPKFGPEDVRAALEAEDLSHGSAFLKPHR
jgi:hypothetical protein